MARRELRPAALEVAQAVRAMLPAGRVIVGCSGGADSLALALGAAWAAPRTGAAPLVVVVDHQLQPGSGEVAERVRCQLVDRNLEVQVRRVDVVDSGAGLEAAARDARLRALEADGVPVLLGHTLDDQAESVLLGLLRGSGTRSLAGMAARRGPFIRPLLNVRSATTRQACTDWGVEPWEDPHNADPRFTRVRARQLLAGMEGSLGRDVAPNLARTAALARFDADLLDELAAADVPDDSLADRLDVGTVADLPPALRLRVLHRWLRRTAPEVHLTHVLAVDELITGWRGQRGVDVPGGTVRREHGQLVLDAR